MDGYFAGRETPGDFERLSLELRGQVPEGDYLAFEYFQIWELSNYNQLPFPGAWVDQPSWVTTAFRWFLKVSHWHRIRKTLTPADELSNVDQLFG